VKISKNFSPLAILFIAALAGCGGGGGAIPSIPPVSTNLYTTLRSVEVHPQYGDPTVQLSVAVAMKANAVRVDYTKEYGEAYYDAFFAAASADNLSVMEITPYIHTDGTFAERLPYSPAAYAVYVAAEATRRCGSVPSLIFEIYNEPDAPNGQANIDYTAYLSLVKATAPAIRAACPSATIITGGTSGLDIGWDQAIASLAPYVDGYGLHPYRQTDDGMRSAITAVQAAFGTSKPVYFTEFGPSIGAFENAKGSSPFWNTYQENLIGSAFSFAGAF